MRDSGFSHAKLKGQITNAEFRPRQGVENAHPRGVSEHAKDLGQAFDDVRIELGHMNTCSYITTMGLPQQPRFGYDRALDRLKTHVLYELREKRRIWTDRRRPVEE